MLFRSALLQAIKGQQDVAEGQQICPECGGPAFSNLILAEKQDACYHKVRSRYKVWPSAYASGALVQCRKKGAANWGNKKKTNEAKESPTQDYQKMMNFVQGQRLSGVPAEQQVAVALFKELEKTKAYNKQLDAELQAAGQRADIGAEQGEITSKELTKHRGELEKEKVKQQASKKQLQTLTQQLDQLKAAPNIDPEATAALERQIADLEQRMQSKQGTGVSADKIAELEKAIVAVQQGETVDAEAIEKFADGLILISEDPLSFKGAIPHASIFLADEKIREYLKPDYVITHAAKAGFSGRLAAMLFYPRAQRIHFFHGHLLYGYFSKPVSYIFKLIEKYIGKFTHKIVAIGSGVQKDLIINGVIDAEKIYVLLPGVKLNIIQSKHLNEKGFNILFVGRLTAIKNPFRVVRLAQLAKDQKLSMKFQVVGGGELLEKLLKTKNDLDLTNLEFYNWQNDLAQFYLQSNLVICTSLNEGVPLALIEATQFGNPIISMSVGSVGDIVKNNYNGFLIEDFDLDFFEYLRKLYEDKELLATFRSNSLEIYKSFTPENMKSKFIEIIQS